MFFQPLSTIKVNLVAIIMPSVFFMCYFSCKAQKITISQFLLVKSRVAAKMATIVDDVTGLQQRQHP